MILRYSLLWFALAIIAIANGILREQTYGKYIPELSAHQLSTLTAIVFMGVFIGLMNRIWPIGSVAQAWTIGGIWLVSTILFEFAFGHYVAGHSWAQLLHDYNVLEGRVWTVFLVWVLIMPVVIHKVF